MSIYLDTSIIVALWVANDSQNDRAATFLKSGPGVVRVSDFAAAEFASVLGRHTRAGTLDREVVSKSLIDCDAWRRRISGHLEIVPADFAAAEAFLRRLDLNLRAPDAIHIAMAGRIGAAMATLDRRMAACAQELGIAVAAA